jgi:hypothetical protein
MNSANPGGWDEQENGPGRAWLAAKWPLPCPYRALRVRFVLRKRIVINSRVIKDVIMREIGRQGQGAPMLVAGPFRREPWLHRAARVPA